MKANGILANLIAQAMQRKPLRLVGMESPILSRFVLE
jgi:hypothetical protein